MSGLGVQTHQPYANFGPQIGFVLSPGSHKTSIRGGAGVYYESDVFNNSGNSRPASITADGPYFNYGVANAGGSSIFLPGLGAVTSAPDGTSVSTILSESIFNAAPEVNAIKAEYQAKVKGSLGPNSSYIGTGGGLFANSIYGGPYVSPYSIQFNGGAQHEFGAGILVSADFVHNATLKIPLSVDVNHDGAARTLNITAAKNAIANTLTYCNVASIDAAIQLCSPSASGGNPAPTPFPATIATFAANGLDSGSEYFGGASASAYGATPDTGAAFPGTNPNVGEGLFILPEGRSKYDALQIVVQEQKSHPLPGLDTSNLQVSYSLSRIESATAGNNPADQFFGGARPYDNDAPTKYIGRNPLDHTNELSFGGSVGVKYGAQIGLIGHFFSAPPTTLFLDATAGNTAQIFMTDPLGDGIVGANLVPGTGPGAYMHQIKGSSLNQLINNYNTSQAGTPTPAGIALVSAGLMTSNELVGLGAVQQKIALQPENHPMNNPAFRSLDFNASYPIKSSRFMKGVSITPGIAMYNAFNMDNLGVQSGILLNTADAGPTALGYVNSSDSGAEANNLRTTRNSGTFDQGGPRTTEFQLMINF